MEEMTKLTRDLRNASATLTSEEARYLVDLYYQIQDFRKATGNQCRAMKDEPHETLSFFSENFEKLEKNIKSSLEKYVQAQPIGKWCMSITGIGPVITAGLLAHIDINKAQTAGQIHAFAGLDPTKEWGKGQKRPFNSKLKVLCWKIGESFVKTSNNEKDIYGHIYVQRKEYEQKKNENGDYAEQAKAKLEKFKIGKTTDAYKAYSEGKLPPAHIHARAKRYAVKLFLSNLFEVWKTIETGERPAMPYAIAILGHAHKFEPPNFDGKNIIV